VAHDEPDRPEVAEPVKIARCELLVLADPPGQDDDAGHIRDLPVLRLRTDEGTVGLSEVFSVPPGVAKAVLDGPDSFFGRLLVGQELVHPEALRTRLYESMLHGNRRGWALICIGAVDVALWDLYGKQLGQPVWRLLGGAERAAGQVVPGHGDGRAVVPYATVWDPANRPDAQIALAVRARELGFRAVKVEPMNSPPATIVEVTRRTREAIGPDAFLAVDVGYLWNDVGTAARVSRQIAPYDVLFLETPFPVDALEAYAALAAVSPVPLAAGEHTVTRFEFLDLIDRGRVGVVQPYMTTCGGLSEARTIVDLARARGVSVCPGNWSTALLGAATVHLALHSPVPPLIEMSSARLYRSPLRRALEDAGLPVDGGAIAPPTAPGIGFELPEELVRRFWVG
jgi:L-alanine-DL-glutamate epimerase-like enolase superfamily enzyme